MGNRKTNLIVFVQSMQPTCAQCLFRGREPYEERKTYALVLLTGEGAMRDLWVSEMEKARKPLCLAPMYTHCMACGHACWIARNENPVRALEEYLVDRSDWDLMWNSVRDLQM
jgi:hypothetical protein